MGRALVQARAPSLIPASRTENLPGVEGGTPDAARSGASTGAVRVKPPASWKRLRGSLNENCLLMDPPEVEYARSGDVAIAYRGRFWRGPVDPLFVFVPFFGNTRWAWSSRCSHASLERLVPFFAPDPLGQAWYSATDWPRTLTLETQMDDIRAVLFRRGLFGASGAAWSYPRQPALCTLRRDVSPSCAHGRKSSITPHASPSDFPRTPLGSGRRGAACAGARERNSPDEITRMIFPLDRRGRRLAALVPRRLPALRGEPLRCSSSSDVGGHWTFLMFCRRSRVPTPSS